MDLITAVDPYSFLYPRVNMLRELLDGFKPKAHLEQLKKTALLFKTRLQHSTLLDLLALFYLNVFPSDDAHTIDIVSGSMKDKDAANLFTYLYRDRYARIPFLLVLENESDLKTASELFSVHTRNTNSVMTWKHYSPFVLTDQISLITAASYSLCVSKSLTEDKKTKSLFTGPLSSSHTQFVAACDLASLHLTYHEYISEIATNHLFPPKLSTVFNIEEKVASELFTTDNDKSANLRAIDPLLSEMLESTHLMTEGRPQDIGKPSFTADDGPSKLTKEPNQWLNVDTFRNRTVDRFSN